MKKYLISLSILLTSCGYRPSNFKEGAIIHEIKTYDEGCIYYCTGKWHDGNIKRDYGYFYADCGKFNVGDTLYLTKKR